jgi:DNA repair protein RadC
LEKYGVEHISQCEEVKEKIRETNFEKYGADYGFQNENIKAKIRATNLEKYGVENISQCEEVMDKITKASYRSKEYTLPSGGIIKIQGYEHFALDELLNQENIDENDIITGCKNVPTVWYSDLNEKKHRHYVDIFISSQNRCIEVKSTWTAKINAHNIFLKQQAAKELGYLYEIWVYDGKGNKVEFYK